MRAADLAQRFHSGRASALNNSHSPAGLSVTATLQVISQLNLRGGLLRARRWPAAARRARTSCPVAFPLQGHIGLNTDNGTVTDRKIARANKIASDSPHTHTRRPHSNSHTPKARSQPTTRPNSIPRATHPKVTPRPGLGAARPARLLIDRFDLLSPNKWLIRSTISGLCKWALLRCAPVRLARAIRGAGKTLRAVAWAPALRVLDRD